MGLGFLGSSAANPGWKYPLYNIKNGKEELLADCVGRKKSTGVVFLEIYWRPCEPAGSVPRSLWVRFGRFGGRQERETEFKEETLPRL